jgi:predicted secreted hydrolase
MKRREFLSLSTFAKVVPGYQYRFPRDHFSHPEFQTEWWYYTGNLTTMSGREFGFELTFFRQALAPEVKLQSVWSTRDAYMAHLALTDVANKRFLHAERLNRPGPGLAGVDAATSRVWNGNWVCELKPERHRLTAVEKEFGFDLQLRPVKPPVVHGVGGLSPKGAKEGQASHYISFPRLAAQGEVAVGGERLTVTGQAWMDHEFFSSELDETLAGWDWFSIQLDNGSELMLYRLRRKDGQTDGFSAGSFIDAQGAVTHLTASEFSLAPGRKWQRYPVEWSIAVPRLGIRIQAQAKLDGQELASSNALMPSYWEGAVRYEGSHRGQGYIEMTGYDTNLRFLRKDAVRK